MAQEMSSLPGTPLPGAAASLDAGCPGTITRHSTKWLPLRLPSDLHDVRKLSNIQTRNPALPKAALQWWFSWDLNLQRSGSGGLAFNHCETVNVPSASERDPSEGRPHLPLPFLQYPHLPPRMAALFPSPGFSSAMCSIYCCQADLPDVLFGSRCPFLKTSKGCVLHGDGS